MFNNYLIDRAMRIKNYKENRRVSDLAYKFSNIDSITDIRLFADEVMRVKLNNQKSMTQIKCISKESLYYGHLSNLLEYAGKLRYSTVEMPTIEHGINFYESFISSNVINSSPCFIFQGSYKKDMVHSINPCKSVFCIGPYINYATHYYSKEKFGELKKKWGKTAVLFPFHTFEQNNSNRKLGSIVRKFYEQFGNRCDTLAVCLYWLDIDDAVIDLFEIYKIKVISSGARFDHNFLKRQKAILDLADVVVGDDIGSYIGYALCEGKSVELLIDEDVIQRRKKLLQGDISRYNENQIRIFGAFAEHDHKQIEEIYKYFWGGKESLKTPEEISCILEFSCRIVRHSLGFDNKFDDVTMRLVRDKYYLNDLISESIGSK